MTTLLRLFTVHTSLRLLVILVIGLGHARAAEELPPASATEQWAPVPPIVSAPVDGVPSDAIVLFDGKNFDAWECVKSGPIGWKLQDGVMVAVPKSGSIRTKAAFGDVQLHVEFRTPAEIMGTGQHRGNSGVILMGLYEVQVLDSYQNETYVNGQCASIYKQHAPLVNASRPPGVWQSYDIVFVTPRFARDGKLQNPARMTVFHNGVLVQHDVLLAGPTVHRGKPAYKAHAAKLPLVLQDDPSSVSFRNVWVRELVLPERK
jgi:hypothetical protein